MRLRLYSSIVWAAGLVVAAVFVLWSAGARADVFVYSDSKGVTHYTNQAGLSGYKCIVEVLKDQGGNNLAHARPDVSAMAKFAPQVDAAAERFNVDKALVHAIITVESGYNPKARSKAGAIGLMQLMPATAHRYGLEDLYDPVRNIDVGVHYFRDLLDQFDGNLELALAAYNAGENAVIKYGGKIPPYSETLNYVPRVMQIYNRYANL